METKESKHRNSLLREKLIVLAKNYTLENLEYMSKNSNVSPEKVIKNVVSLHIQKDTVKRIFKQRADKLLNN